MAPRPDPQAPGRTLFRGLVNGSEDFNGKQRDELKVTRQRAELWRDYYGFLMSLPMGLTQTEGAKVDPKVRSEMIDGASVLVVRLDFGGDGNDRFWDFFLDPESTALRGARFFSTVPEDGETILFDGEVESGGVRLPKKRTWYITKSDKLLGSDTIQAFALD